MIAPQYIAPLFYIIACKLAPNVLVQFILLYPNGTRVLSDLAKVGSEGDTQPDVKGLVRVSGAGFRLSFGVTEFRHMLDWPRHPIGRGPARLDGD